MICGSRARGKKDNYRKKAKNVCVCMRGKTEKGKMTVIVFPLKQVETRPMVLNPFNLSIKIWIPG